MQARTTELVFSEQFAFDIAMGWTVPRETCAKHGVDKSTFEALSVFEPFRMAVAAYRKDLVEHGVTAALKAKVAVEDLVPCLRSMVKDEDVPAASRVAAFRELKDIAGIATDTPNQGIAAGALVHIYQFAENATPKDVTPAAGTVSIELP